MKAIYLLLIRPIEYILEIVFNLFFRFSGSIPYSIIGLSLTVSLLSLPLYTRAETIAENERKSKEKISKWEKHIRNTFKNDEQSFMIQKYYHIMDYRPYESFRGVLPLLLQIPFFTAAYHMLSDHELLNGCSVWKISDLAMPDGLMVIGGTKVNVLPVIMTLISIIAGAIYTRGMAWKDKWNVFLLPGIFMLLLYGSPSGLVLYWTMNNVFSLVKNIVGKYSRHKTIWKCIAAVALLFMFFFATVRGKADPYYKMQMLILLVAVIVMAILLILMIRYIKGRENNEIKDTSVIWDRLWIEATVLLILLSGGWIPVNLLVASPLEFIIKGSLDNPLSYFYQTICIATGFFGLAGGVVYYMIHKKRRWTISFIMVCIALSAVVNFVFFGKNLKTIGANLVYPDSPEFYGNSSTVNMVIMLILPLSVCVLLEKKKVLEGIMIVAIICIALFTVRDYINTSSVIREGSELEGDNTYKDKYIELSKNGKNVVIIMLDRAINGYVPYIMEEKPELRNKFEGFVYYPNTICFGSSTSVASHPAYGGYEYVPDEFSKRVECTSKEVADEAQKVLPVLFSENGYDATMCDPPSTGAHENSRVYLYKDYPDIKAYDLLGKFTDKGTVKQSLDLVERNFFLYSVFRMLPEILSPIMYDFGAYMNYEMPGNMTLMYSYAEFDVLPQISSAEEADDSKGSFCYIYNLLPHEPTSLQMPDYVIASDVDNEPYKENAIDKFYNNKNYAVNMASLRFLAEWFDWMRYAGVYDNTRIIIVADHGWANHDFEEMIFDIPGAGKIDVEKYNPLLLYKDFGSEGDIVTSEEFMTNADVPWLAVNGLIVDPVNPFTEVLISPEQKRNTPLYISEQGGRTSIDGGIEYSTGPWYSVDGNMFDKKSWTWHPGVK